MISLFNSIRPFGSKCARYRTRAIDITERDRYAKDKGIKMNTLWSLEIKQWFFDDFSVRIYKQHDCLSMRLLNEPAMSGGRKLNHGLTHCVGEAHRSRTTILSRHRQSGAELVLNREHLPSCGGAPGERVAHDADIHFWLIPSNESASSCQNLTR